ncbi:MAG: hypothetical protein ABH834_06665 [Candidatus Altiarchaeota archaeon]
MAVKQANGMRLDYFMNIVDRILANEELEAIVGTPIEKHVALVVEDNHLRFYAVQPHGEERRELPAGQKARMQEITEEIIKTNFAGSTNLPEIR